MEVGRSIPRVDAADKVTGRAKYTDDLCPRPVLEAKILHSTIANGWVKSMDISAAQALPGVVKVLTCFDVPDIQYPTPGHPWSVEKAHQDVSDRKLLNRRVAHLRRRHRRRGGGGRDHRPAGPGAHPGGV